MNDPRFLRALAVYSILAVLAGVTLDGTPRLAAWIALAGIALKTWLVVLKRRVDADSDSTSPDSDSVD